jgi:hypothetical protein
LTAKRMERMGHLDKTLCCNRSVCILD